MFSCSTYGGVEPPLVEGGVLGGWADDGGVLVFGALGAMNGDGEGGLKAGQLVGGVLGSFAFGVTEPCLPSPVGDADVAVQEFKAGRVGGENDGV